MKVGKVMTLHIVCARILIMACNLCVAGVEGQEWMDAVVLGKKTPSQCATKFRMSINDVMEHIYEHSVMNVVSDEELAARNGTPGVDPGIVSMDFYTTEIMQILAYLKRYSKSLSLHQVSSTKDIEIALKVMRELRLTIESLAEFQGRINTKSHTTINIDTMNMKLLSITNVIRTRLCPKCRQEMISAVADLDESQQQPHHPMTLTIIPETTSNTSQQ